MNVLHIRQLKMSDCLLGRMCSKGIAAVIGGILIHLTLGNLYSFGNMMTYMASYMHIRVDPSIDYGNFIWVNSITTAAQGCFMVLGGLLEKRVGPKITCFVGCSLLSAGIMLTRYTIEVSLFAVTMTYGLLSGLGISLSYVTPLACGMKWFPERKGFINGMIVAGFGLGALGSTNFQTMYLNPDNLPPETDGYFRDPDLLNRVPGVFITLGVIFLVMQYTGCLLLSKPKNDHHLCQQEEGEGLLEPSETENAEEREPISTAVLTDRDLKPMEMIRNKTFYQFWLIYFFNTIAIGYINAMYKSFGLSFILDDHFLAVIGSLSAIFNAVGRVFWGRLMDKTSFRVAMRLLSLLLAILFATLPLTSSMGKVGFAIWIWMIFFTFSGTFVLMPTVVEKAFGSQYYSANYGLLFTSQTISGPLVAALNHLMLDAVGYTGCFLSISGVICMSFIMTFIVPRGL
ncbi:oxalate:formate antiporter-like [Penaeus japonicus]|uniref:oxalate:formate antiporter-like n=1 Tax=Penaeus japonicus TaxID=27405 RepID=UPI001C70FEBE|nr:oxalate:formate antiporter-like [Penaeus japonicus]XP_042863507.1 oxalate:formate antiporter-like [Penaeus japonicus]